MTAQALPDFRTATSQLAQVGRRFYERNWVLGTSGNLSALISRRPVTLAITSSAVHKGTLTHGQFLKIDGDGQIVDRKARGGLRPSAETLLHLEIVKQREAGAVLHTHSVWSTLLSDLHGDAGGLAIEGFEMLKGLEGVKTHEHREWVPIFENDQDMTRLAQEVRATLGRFDHAHAFLLRRHGLYTWGRTLADAERHVEILEFLFETIGRGSVRAAM
jgi:methylthioribulose-1-phosphate dehydratase